MTAKHHAFMADQPIRIVYSVSRLVSEVSEILNSTLPRVWLQGEISNFSQPRSGHWYFNLKDADSQVRCAMFRGNNRLLRFTPKDGQEVLIRGRVGLYKARGEFQIVAEHMEAGGEGALRQEFERLKAQLSAEGLFDDDRKQALPKQPKQLGIITSATGAAIQDALKVLGRRYPTGKVTVFPCVVQGKEAAPSIRRALECALDQNTCETLLIVRGGGSIEDLWAFNDETLVRAIADCPIPVISGVGHETDFTLVDFVADQRAPTPSAAAELATIDSDEIRRQFRLAETRLQSSLRQRLNRQRTVLGHLEHRVKLGDPRQRLQQQMQRVDQLERQLLQAIQRQTRTADLRQSQATIRLTRLNPGSKTIPRLNQQRSELSRRLGSALQSCLSGKGSQLAASARNLNTVSPLGVLERGYSIASSKNQVVTDASTLAPGDSLQLQFRHGSANCEVLTTNQE